MFVTTILGVIRTHFESASGREHFVCERSRAASVLAAYSNPAVGKKV